ncbi:MAG TPA: class I SAM-dependent methyltransferase [Ktedonobacteraceae bacterium]|nr:class I SAM-dependent methyltransferase [Ktedonobacteraceae bacterium]
MARYNATLSQSNAQRSEKDNTQKAMNDFSDATPITMNAYQHIAGLYAETHSAFVVPLFWRECMQRFAKAVHNSPAYLQNPTLPIVDIGCGPGRDALLLAQIDLTIVGTDLSEAMLDEAKKRTVNQPEAERITFRRMDMRHLEFADASCAGLWVSASFLHIPKRENLAVLQEFVRVLPTGGPITLLVKEQDAGETERYEVQQKTGATRFFARYNGAELWALLEQTGLQVWDISAAHDARVTDEARWLGALAIKR